MDGNWTDQPQMDLEGGIANDAKNTEEFAAGAGAAKRAEPAVPETPGTGVIMLDPDQFEVSRRIMSGQMTRIEITADMVGEEIWISGDIVRLSQRKPATKIASGLQRMSKPERLVHDILRDMAGTPMGIDDIANLARDLGPYKDYNSARGSVGRPLASLLARGLIRMDTTGGRKTYHHVPG